MLALVISTRVPDGTVPPLIASTVPLTVSISAPVPEACNFPGPVTLTLSSKSKVGVGARHHDRPGIADDAGERERAAVGNLDERAGLIVLPLIRSALPLAVSINEAVPAAFNVPPSIVALISSTTPPPDAAIVPARNCRRCRR